MPGIQGKKVQKIYRAAMDGAQHDDSAQILFFLLLFSAALEGFVF